MPQASVPPEPVRVLTLARGEALAVCQAGCHPSRSGYHPLTLARGEALAVEQHLRLRPTGLEHQHQAALVLVTKTDLAIRLPIKPSGFAGAAEDLTQGPRRHQAFSPLEQLIGLGSADTPLDLWR